MKYGYIKLVNYKRIYNGLGINELFIDFKKCKNRIILIKGNNGTGKSSLLEYLNLYPDNNESFISGVQAIKEIELIDNDNIYHIQFIHDIKSNNDRDTTKVFIQKNGIEMNSNGNVSSYKEYLELELNLDPNFLFLSKVGIEDKGIVEKTPTNRKKYVISLISKLGIYNDMNKTLVKRSSIFKSMINRISSKIDSIGDDQLQNELLYLNKKINDNEKEKDIISEKIAFNKSTISYIDPDQSIQNEYSEIYSKVNEYNNLIQNIEIKLLDYKDTSISELSDLYIKENNIISDLKNKNIILDNNINNSLNIRENKSQELIKKSNKLNSLSSKYNYLELENNIKIYSNRLNELEIILKNIGLDINNISITQDEFIIAINILNEIKSEIDIVKDSYSYSILESTIGEYMNTDINIIKLENENINLYNKLNKLKLDLSEYEGYAKISDLLKLRPSNCKIDNCNFIKESIEASKYNPYDNIENISNEINNIESTISNNIEYISKFKDIYNCKSDIIHIIRKIKSYSNIFKKIPILKDIIQEEYIYDRILNNSDFIEIENLYKNISDMNIISEYNELSKLLYELNIEYKIYLSKNESIEEINSEIEELSREVDSISSKIEEYRNEINSNSLKIYEYELSGQNLKNIISEKEKLDSLIKEKNEYILKFKNIKENMDKINFAINDNNNLINNLNQINNILKELNKRKGELEFTYKTLLEYKKELEEFNNKYYKIETLKRHSSTKEGIQLLYIELYLNNTIHLANELLNILYKGSIFLYDFKISEDEFSIPCSIEGLLRDDISNASLSQKCMMSMIINFVLLQQSSTNFNILRLDEIDTGLDEYNRTQFVNMFYKLISLLNIEQCIMISHNTEINTRYTDLILFKVEDKSIYNDSNIIFNI